MSTTLPIGVPDIAIYAGDTITSPAYVFKGGNPAEPIDLVTAGWTDWKAQWRPQLNDPRFVELTVQTENADQGVIYWTVTAEQTRKMWVGVWDLQSINSITGEVRTWVRGAITYREDITR